MGYRIWHLLRDAYQALGELQVSKATGGSTTSIVDSKLVNTGKDDDWKGGEVIILEDAGGAGVAPEGEFGRVSAYSDATGTLTMEALSTGVAAGDVYGLVPGHYPLQQMIELANLALRGLGDVALVDTTSLDTAAGQTEYPAAVSWKRRPPRRVDIQTKINDGDHHGWVTVRDWDYVPSAAGSSGLIVFKTQPVPNRDLRIWYQDAHPRVSTFDDVIHETICPALATAALVEIALTWQLSRLERDNRFMVERLNDAKMALDRQKMLHPIWQPGKIGRGLEMGRK